jgi:fumarylacetoacetate (FAA) hydrolase
VSNRAIEKEGKKEWIKGYSCIAEKRAIETILDGKPSTAYMKFGDTIKIEMKGKDGQSVFGAIEQKVVSLHAPKIAPAL